MPPVPTERKLETPGDLERLVQELMPALGAGVLTRLDDDGPGIAELELAALLGASTWPDVIDAKFADQYGRRYHLFVDVYHGAGGHWRRLSES